MEGWEYRTLAFETRGLVGGKMDVAQFDERLNDLGVQGWELVSVFSTNQGYGMTRAVFATLKRRK
jgi:hypothetical protein